MTIEQLQTLHHARPFQPFTMHLADGKTVHVPHPDFLSRSSTGRTVIVHGEGDSFNIVDTLLVTRHEIADSEKATSNGK